MSTQGDPRTLPAQILDLAEQVRALQSPSAQAGVVGAVLASGPASYPTGGFPLELADLPLRGVSLTRLSVGAWGLLNPIVTLDLPAPGFITVRLDDAGGELAAASDVSDLAWSILYLT